MNSGQICDNLPATKESHETNALSMKKDWKRIFTFEPQELPDSIKPALQE